MNAAIIKYSKLINNKDETLNTTLSNNEIKNDDNINNTETKDTIEKLNINPKIPYKRAEIILKLFE